MPQRTILIFSPEIFEEIIVQKSFSAAWATHSRLQRNLLKFNPCAFLKTAWGSLNPGRNSFRPISRNDFHSIFEWLFSKRHETGPERGFHSVFLLAVVSFSDCFHVTHEAASGQSKSDWLRVCLSISKAILFPVYSIRAEILLQLPISFSRNVLVLVLASSHSVDKRTRPTRHSSST